MQLLTADWQEKLTSEFQKDYFLILRKFLMEEYKNHQIFPEKNQILKIFEICAFEQVKVVILGQDPYHGKNQAHGLAFSVPEQIQNPPSLQNIFKEIQQDLNISTLLSPDLTRWVRQGVFLLNTCLTVREAQAGSHQGKGWEIFTDFVLKLLNDEKENLVFLLWGRPAIAKQNLLNPKKHLILTAPHPSPLSAYRGFLGSKHFSQTNEYLKNHGKMPIDWR